MSRFLPLAFLALAACGGTAPQYLIDQTPAAAVTQTRVRVATVEVRNLSLPAYAENAKILAEAADGSVAPLKQAEWADDPVRALTLRLAEQIGRTSSATAAAEPWPLETPAQAAVDVRVSEMLARTNGAFTLKGQFALSSYGHVIRERIEPFEITVPLEDRGPGGIARASGAAMSELARRIVAELAR